MTSRPLLWITATAVVLGAAAWAPSSAGAANLGWTITIDDAAPATTHSVVVAGTAELGGGLTKGTVDEVTVSLVPQNLPEACGAGPMTRTVLPSGDRFEVGMDVACNGTYAVEVVARGSGALGLESSSGEPEVGSRAVAVTTAPAGRVEAEVTDGGAVATWDAQAAAAGPDTVGWVLVVNQSDEYRYDDPATSSANLSGSFDSAEVSLRVLRWGAGGPGTEIASDQSEAVVVTGRGPTPPPGPVTPGGESAIPNPPPSPGGPSGDAQLPPGGTTPTPTTGGEPSRGSGSPATLPEGYSEELPFGSADDAFVPGSSTTVADPDGDERAATASPPAGLVRTTEKRSPGLVAPFALALLMITIAAHITWYLRRSKPSGGGQVSLS